MRTGVAELRDRPGELHLLVLGEHDGGVVSKHRQRAGAEEANGGNEACSEASGHYFSLMFFGKRGPRFERNPRRERLKWARRGDFASGPSVARVPRALRDCRTRQNSPVGQRRVAEKRRATFGHDPFPGPTQTM